MAVYLLYAENQSDIFEFSYSDDQYSIDNPKKLILKKIFKSFNNILNWVVFFFPLIFVFFEEYEKITAIQVLF